MRMQGFIRDGFDARYLVAEKIENVLPMLRAAAGRRSAEREREGAGAVRDM